MAWRFDPEKIERRRLERELQDIAALDASPESDGLCYFIGCDVEDDDSIVKIGFSTSVRRRFKQIRGTAALSKLILLATARGGRSRELFYHRKFAAHRCGGEWFRFGPDIRAEVARLSALASDAPTLPYSRTRGREGA